VRTQLLDPSDRNNLELLPNFTIGQVCTRVRALSVGAWHIMPRRGEAKNNLHKPISREISNTTVSNSTFLELEI
jgi:hypothetical protein